MKRFADPVGNFDDKDFVPSSQLGDIGEIDLHHYSTGVALAHFVSYYNDSTKCKSIKVIHGYGKTGQGGEIRSRLRTFLKDHIDYLQFEIGEEIDSNPGYTVVYPKRPLPPISDGIENKILGFCANAKSDEKIFGEFRLYGDVEVRKALHSLQRQGRIRSIDKGKYKLY